MKKIELKPILISIILVLFESVCYLISKTLSTTPHLIGNKIDSLIPFNIYFIIPYISWYILLFIIPYYLYKKNKNIFTKYTISFITITIITNIIFICYPTTINRVNIIGNDILSIITKLIFYIDTPILNCFPSQHCAISMLWILYILEIKNSNKKIKSLIIIDSILIMASTLLIKQHVFIDFISGITLSTIIFFIIKKEIKITNKIKELLKIK